MEHQQQFTQVLWGLQRLLLILPAAAVMLSLGKLHLELLDERRK